MKIAVAYENGQVFQHFGQSPSFKIYSIEQGAVVGSSIVVPERDMHCAMGGWLAQNGVEALICGGIGQGAINALGSGGMQVCNGVQGDADNAVQAFISGSLSFDPHARCQEHEHSHEDGCAHRN